MRSLAIAALSILCAVGCFAQAGPPFQFRFTEPSGPNALGVKVIEQNDTSRLFEG